IDLDGALTLIIHLRMTGDLAIAPAGAPLHPHTRVLFALGSEELRFVDQRRFGHMDLLPAARVDRLSGLRRLGEEPLARRFTLDRFRGLLRGRRGMLKALLLRQDLVAGIGNLYADEILFQARLRPARPAESLRPPDVARLHGAIRAVLRRATDGLARSGSGKAAATLLDARGREGACPRCGRALAAASVRGRYASEGEWYPFGNEAPDGMETLAWVRAQRWCDGRVATMGLSYSSCTQTSLAAMNPPGLAAQFVSQGFHNYHTASMRQGGA